jgi:hypothetical protein
MPFRITIDGVERADKVDWAPGPVVINNTLLRRPTASFHTVPDYFPTRFHEVVIYDEDLTTPIFGGLIQRRTVKGLIDRVAPSRTQVSCLGFISYADYAFISLSYTVDTALEDVVDDIVTAKLAQYGITYTPAATGITLAPFVWVNKRVSDALRELGDRSKRRIEVSPTKVLTVTTPGAVAATLSTTDASPNCYDIDWDDEGEIVPNKIIMVCGSGTRQTVESFLGSDGVSDGTFTNFYTQYSAVYDYNGIWPQLINLDGVPTPVIWEAYAPVGHAWLWDPVNSRIRYRESFGALSPTLSITSVSYVIQYPFQIEDDLGLTPVIEELITRPDVLYRDQGLELLATLLDQRTKLARRVRVHTPHKEFAINTLVTINITDRGVLNDNFLITDQKIEIRSNEVRHYFCTCIPSTDSKGNFVDEWKELIIAVGGGGSSSSSVAASATGSGGAAAPIRSVQFNTGGVLDGSDHFRFIDETNSLIAGEDCDIAANAYSSQAFGKNNVIGVP